MKKLVLISTVLFAVSSFSQDLGLGKLSKIEGADLLCEQKGVMFAFDFEPGKERVWQSDPGQVEGYELSTVDVKPLRCKTCYHIDGKMEFPHANIRYQFDIRGTQGGKAVAEVTIKVDGQLKNMTLSCYDHLR